MGFSAVVRWGVPRAGKAHTGEGLCNHLHNDRAGKPRRNPEEPGNWWGIAGFLLMQVGADVPA